MMENVQITYVSFITHLCVADDRTTRMMFKLMLNSGRSRKMMNDICWQFEFHVTLVAYNVITKIAYFRFVYRHRDKYSEKLIELVKFHNSMFNLCIL